MKNILHIQRGEGAKVLTLCSYLFCVVGAGIAGKAARDSYFLSRYDKSLLPIMLVACAGSVVLAVTVYTRLCKWAGSRTLFHLSNAVFVATLVLISLRLRGWVMLHVLQSSVGDGPDPNNEEGGPSPRVSRDGRSGYRAVVGT